MAGTGKRTRLHEALAAVAAARGMPFSIQPRALAAGGSTGDVTEAGATEEGAGPGDDATQFTYEASLVHIGFDIARMSMQDKLILRPVLAKLGQGSQVLAGEQGRGARILVLYHAHLLSSESVLALQACLERNEGDLSVWLTSEMPVPLRIRDWFVELPVAGPDHSFEAFRAGVETTAINWPDIFRALIDKWRAAPRPRLSDIKEVKAFVYELLMRNLRLVEATHFLLDTILSHPELSLEQRRGAVAALAACEATGGGYTIPSYRIPILWESLFLQLRAVFAPTAAPIVPQPQVDGVPRRTGGIAARAKRAAGPSKKSRTAATTEVA